jgi:hypothetical protein
LRLPSWTLASMIRTLESPASRVMGCQAHTGALVAAAPTVISPLAAGVKSALSTINQPVVWLVAGADLFWDKSTADWLLLACLF